MTTAGLGAVRPASEKDVLRAAFHLLRQRMPPQWSFDVAQDEQVGRSQPDAVMHLRSPDGARAVVVIEAKTVLEARDVISVRDQLALTESAMPGSTGMVVARYLAKSVRDRLADAGLSYADATGNLLIRITTPGLYIADRGADRDPWRGPGRPRGTLKGEPAAKVVRALVDEPWPWKVTDLIAASKASTGSVYRVVDYLEAEALVVRDAEGRITVPDWGALLRRWSEDYQFLLTNAVSRWIAPRGIDALLSQITGGAEDAYAVTGTIAAAERAAYAPARNAMIYVADAARAANAWGLRATDSGVNVLLAEPAYPFVLNRPDKRSDGLKVVKPSQAVVDLLTGPGRSPSEAEELMEWMRVNEGSWRR